uniref:SGNH hydrolase-type esterase domain-containing protein n=1 Tax=Astatotilapia calliptera TaxID=8154 RepID=A0A3P8RHM4_ASTCA
MPPCYYSPSRSLSTARNQLLVAPQSSHPDLLAPLYCQQSQPEHMTGVLYLLHYQRTLDIGQSSIKSSEVRSENLLKSKRPQGKLKARPETLIVGNSAVKDVQRMCGKNTKVLCFPNDMVNNLKERILQIADEYPTVTNIVLHTGSNDVSKQQSEVLKRDFTGLLNTVNSLNAAVFVSGPVPPVRGGDERFSRLFTLNKWLISACADHSVHFINNFNIFWERRHLFKENGFNFNKSGVKLGHASFCVTIFKSW